MLRFPPGFLWGTATSAYQVEGGIKNCDWSNVFVAGRTCDHYNLYEQDFDLIKKLNNNAYRFSIEWARIEPEEGKFNQKEIEHYREVILALRRRGIEPFVTLHHFTSPLWLAKIGGWENEKVVFYFSRYAKRVFEEYKDLVNFWVTINEPLVYSTAAYIRGVWPPKKINPISFIKVYKNQIESHKEVFRTIHELKPDAKIGIVANITHFESWFERSPGDNVLIELFKFAMSPIGNGLTKLFKYCWNDAFLIRIKDYFDFVGLNYYSGFRLPFGGIGEKTEMGWRIYPKGIFYCLRELQQKYQKPIYITENGLADSKDKQRKKFLQDHVLWVWLAMKYDVDVRGYFHWSLMDNMELHQGFRPRFGLIEIDYKTVERKFRPSAYFYSEICKNNALP